MPGVDAGFERVLAALALGGKEFARRHREGGGDAGDQPGQRDDPRVLHREGEPREGSGQFDERVVEPEHHRPDVLEPLLVEQVHQRPFMRVLLRHDLGALGHLRDQRGVVVLRHVLPVLHQLDREGEAEHPCEQLAPPHLQALRLHLLAGIFFPNIAVDELLLRQPVEHLLVFPVLERGRDRLIGGILGDLGLLHTRIASSAFCEIWVSRSFSIKTSPSVTFLSGYHCPLF